MKNEWNSNSVINDEGFSHPGSETRKRQHQKMFRQRSSEVSVKRPNLTQDEIKILKAAWAQDCPNGAVHSL